MPTDTADASTSDRSTRALIYVRVSSDKSGEARSVVEQEAACRAECERRGWSVVDVLRDNSYSATRRATRERPEYERAGRMLRAGAAGILVCWANSRAQRTLDEYVDLRRLCTDHGVLWSYSGRVYDLSKGSDRFSTGVDALVSEREAENLRDATIRAVEARAARGGAHGRLPDGYLVEYDPGTGRPLRRVLDPVRAPLIREAAERILAGESAWSVAADFNTRGLTSRTGKPWTGANIVKRLQSPTICGRRVHRGQVLDDVRGDWPPLLDEETFDRLQALLRDPARRDSRNGPRVRHLGTGIYGCGVCGARVRMITKARKSGERHARYSCASAHCVSRSTEPVDALVEAVVTRFLARPDVVAELRDDDPGEDVRTAQAEVARLRANLDDARRKVDEGAITLDDFAHFRSRWEPQLAAAERRARPRWVPEAVFDVAGEQAVQRWTATSIERRRAIVKALFSVRIMPTDRRDGTFDADAVLVERREPEVREPAPEPAPESGPPFAPELVTDRPPHEDDL